MITDVKKNETRFMLTYRNITSTSYNRIMTKVTSLKLLIARDPNKVFQIKIIV